MNAILSMPEKAFLFNQKSMAKVPIEQQGPEAVGRLPKFASRIGLGIVGLMALAPFASVAMNAIEGKEWNDEVSYFNPDSYNFDSIDDFTQTAINVGYVAAMLFVLYFSTRSFRVRNPQVVRSEPVTVYKRKPAPLS